MIEPLVQPEFVKLLDKLLEIAEQVGSCERALDTLDLHGSGQWLDEYGTIRLKGPRQCGHTGAIRAAALRLSEQGKRVHTFVPYPAQVEWAKSCWKGCGEIATPAKIQYLRGFCPDYVFVDCASHMTDRMLADVRGFAAWTLSRRHLVFLVLMG